MARQPRGVAAECAVGSIGGRSQHSKHDPCRDVACIGAGECHVIAVFEQMGALDLRAIDPDTVATRVGHGAAAPGVLEARVGAAGQRLRTGIDPDPALLAATGQAGGALVAQLMLGDQLFAFIDEKHRLQIALADDRAPAPRYCDRCGSH